MPLDEALEFIATEGFFWIQISQRIRHGTCKLKLSRSGNCCGAPSHSFRWELRISSSA